MKTKTYARLSLFIPLLVWIISLLLLLFAYVFLPDTGTIAETPSLVAVVGVLLLFYVIGIVYWLIPYGLVSLILFLLSFISTEKVLKVVYPLSPILMASLIMIVMTTLTITPPESSLLTADLASTFQDSIGTGFLFAIITLIWGYLCVGLGFGGYKLLQHLGMFQEETNLNAETIIVNS